jgi:hypothetical protein
VIVPFKAGLKLILFVVNDIQRAELHSSRSPQLSKLARLSLELS